MSLWNVFKMELYKNIHDRVSLLLMAAIMSMSIISIIGDLEWLLVFAIFGTFVFLFVYPYRMARMDYRNKVMSLLIASGVSRIQYYFVKIGATMLFSFISVILLVVIPVLFVLGIHEFRFVTGLFLFYLRPDIAVIGTIFSVWISTFSVLMTAVIISKGRGFSIFVFMGILFANSQLSIGLRRLFDISLWGTISTIMFVEALITMTLMGLIGILVLRRQNL